MSGKSDNDTRLQLELDYASGWFQYTASQRLTTFNFFLIVVGLVAVAYAQAIDHQWNCFGAVIGGIGAIISVGFLVIDIRNEVLVDKGLSALQELELDMRIKLADPALDSKHLKEVLRKSFIGRGVSRCVYRSLRWSKRCERVFKYRFWFRFVITVVGISLGFGCVWAARGFPGVAQSTNVNCRESTVLMLHRPDLDLSLVRRSESEGNQRGADDDPGGPGDGLGGDRHVETVGVGDNQRIQTGRHCREEPVSGG